MGQLKIHTGDKKRASKQVMWELTGVEQLMTQLKQLDFWVRNDIAEEALKKASQPVLRSMRSNVPDSARTQSRSKMSQKSKNTWSGSKKLRDSLTFVIRRKGGWVSSFIGPDYKAGGGHGNLFSKDHKRAVYWGRDAGGIRKVNQFVKKAADENAAMVQTIVVAVIKKELARLLR